MDSGHGKSGRSIKLAGTGHISRRYSAAPLGILGRRARARYPTAEAKIQRHDGVEDLIPTMPAARPLFRPPQGLLVVQLLVGGWEGVRTSALRPSVKRRKIKLHHSSKINTNVNPLAGRNIQ